MLLFPVTWMHGTVSLNTSRDSVGEQVPTDSIAATVIDRVEIDPDFRDLMDPLHLATGGTLGRIHRGMKRIDIFGHSQVADAQRADMNAALVDAITLLTAAFDPATCLRDSPSTEGAYELRFSDPTADIATYPAESISKVYYARPLRRLRTVEDNKFPVTRRWVASLVAPDPREYERTEQTLVLSPGTPSGAVVNRGTVAAPLKATIVMAGAGSGSFVISSNAIPFGVNLSGAAPGDVYVVTFESSGPYGTTVGRSITKNGVTQTLGLMTTLASTWKDVPVGSTTFTIANNTNVTSCTLAWHSARS